MIFDGKTGYIDKTGKIVIEPKFDFLSSIFSEGLADVMIDGKVGYINKSGKIIIEPKFDSGFAFRNNLAIIRLNKKFGFIDKSGKIVIEPKFDNVGNFGEEGLATVMTIQKVKN